MKTTPEKSTIIEPFPALIKALKDILYPFVHLLMKVGISFPQLAEMLKEIYVDVADKHFQLENKNQTQTRLSFLTGVHRKDVKRFQTRDSNTKEPENINIGVKLVSLWINDPRFLDKDNNPLKLPLKGETSSFDELVKIVCKQDIRSRVVLDEWLNSGVVTLNDNIVELCTEAYIPKESPKEKAFFLGHNIGDHLRAASQNLFSDTPEFFERCVYYDNLSEESIAELQSLVNDHGMSLLKSLNDRASELSKIDAKREDVLTDRRINIGLYLYHQSSEKIKQNE